MVVDFESKFPIRDTRVLELATGIQVLIPQIFPCAIIPEGANKLDHGIGSGCEDLVFVISQINSHINPGIANGSALVAPRQWMSGTGNNHQHVKSTRLDQLRDRQFIV